MSGPKQEKERKPRVLRLHCWTFEYAKIRGRAKCTGRSVDMYQFREVGEVRTIYSMKAHAYGFELDAFQIK